MVEFLDLGETDIDHCAAAGTRFAQHLRQAVQRLRAEHHVDVGRAGTDRLALLARDATADADDHAGFLLFQFLPAPELRKHFFLRFFANRAGIQ